MELVKLTADNIADEHICCSISDKKGESCVANKKAWLRREFGHGLVFLKGNVRGKVFIEYIPAENAWCPIAAPGYIFINCLWVSGQYKGQGYSNNLLDSCIDDAKKSGKKGLVILSSDKKRPFLADPKYLQYKGFRIADSAYPYFKLYYLPFEENSAVPKFNESVKRENHINTGLTLYYSDQCPFTEKYACLIKNLAEESGIEMKLIKFNSANEAQNSPAPFTTYSLFHNGKFITGEILSEKKFRTLVESLGCIY
ncbi:MAG: YoaP domain-containing protein [Rikenellaceae bacterium]|nr:YoaP domain-containing protein [Rikenellaceae bacterium]